MVLVKMNEDAVLNTGPVESGDVVDVSDDVASALVQTGTAEYVNPPEDNSEEEATPRRTSSTEVKEPDPDASSRVKTDVSREVTPQRPKPRTE